MQKKMTKQFGVTRGQIYKKFYDAHSEADFQIAKSSPEKLHEYSRTNWLECKNRWSLAFRRTFRLIGNNTNNYAEAFFVQSKQQLQWFAVVVHI